MTIALWKLYFSKYVYDLLFSTEILGIDKIICQSPQCFIYNPLLSPFRCFLDFGQSEDAIGFINIIINMLQRLIT